MDHFRPPTAEDLRQDDENRFESLMVEAVLQHHEVPTECRQHVKIAGIGYTFAAFHDYYPDYPMYFGVCVIRHLAKRVNVGNLLTQFKKLPLLPAFDSLHSSIPDTANEDAVGLIIRWPHLAKAGGRPTGLVLHNWHPSPAAGQTYMNYTDEKGRPLTLQSLSSLLARIKSEYFE